MRLICSVLVVLLSFFVLPALVFAESKPTDFKRSQPMKIAIGPCQSQCFEGAVEYNPQTLKLTKIERYDAAQKVWTAIPVANLDRYTRDAALQALDQVTQNMTLPGFCTESECTCKIPSEKPPFSAWTSIVVHSDYAFKSDQTQTDYRAQGTVDYRSRVTQGQCDLTGSTKATLAP